MKKTFLVVLALIFSFSANAKDDSAKKALEKELSRLSSSIKVMELEKISGLDNVYQAILSSGEIVYTDNKSSFIMFGNFLDMRQKEIKNLTEIKETQFKTEKLEAVSSKDTINYAAKGKRRSLLYIFTDISCPYCHKMHDEIPALSKQGIEVRYLAFPRSGLKGDTYKTMHNIWCASNRHKALDAGYKNKSVAKASSLCKSLVSEQFNLGRQLGVTGTPAVFTQDGKQIGGYAQTSKILKALKLDRR